MPGVFVGRFQHTSGCLQSGKRDRTAHASAAPHPPVELTQDSETLVYHAWSASPHEFDFECRRPLSPVIKSQSCYASQTIPFTAAPRREASSASPPGPHTWELICRARLIVLGFTACAHFESCCGMRVCGQEEVGTCWKISRVNRIVRHLR